MLKCLALCVAANISFLSSVFSHSCLCLTEAYCILSAQFRDWSTEQKSLHTLSYCFSFVPRVRDGRGGNGNFSEINGRLMLLDITTKT